MIFTALDFETANATRSSVCAIGLAQVKGKEVTHRIHQLIRPEPMDFDPFNISIHGITENDVRDAPTFGDYWGEFCKAVEGPLVAHNASFDMSVLRHSLDLYNQPYPDIDYYCTRVIAKMAWPNSPTYALGHVARTLGIAFEHHNASEDALACAQVALQACMMLRVDQLSDLEALGLHIGHLYPGGYVACGGQNQRRVRKKDVDVPRFERLTSGPKEPESHSFFEKHFAFTGAMSSMSRKEALLYVQERGGQHHGTVGLTTNYLVLGQKGFIGYASGHRSTKIRRAEELACSGAPIEIMSEQDFIEML
ncbi:MAG: 3'-5' exoribonuclease [Lentisphaerae bacterium]|nr:3'-5' exoribonuclease [Lentisphaerota bacterium]